MPDDNTLTPEQWAWIDALPEDKRRVLDVCVARALGWSVVTCSYSDGKMGWNLLDPQGNVYDGSDHNEVTAWYGSSWGINSRGVPHYSTDPAAALTLLVEMQRRFGIAGVSNYNGFWEAYAGAVEICEGKTGTGDGDTVEAICTAICRAFLRAVEASHQQEKTQGVSHAP